MQNFSNTEWEGLTEEEVFLLNRRLVITTVRRKFPNNQYFCKAHMLDLDDLVQLGNIGLLNAIRTFEPIRKSSFRTYAINCISWSISTNAKKESLRTVNTQSYDLAKVVSVDTPLNMNGNEEEAVIFLNTIEANENTSETAEGNLLQQQVIEFLKADKDIDDELLYILIARTKEKTMREIAKHFGKHPNAISQRLKTQKAIRVKNRLRKFLKNRDY